jgi:hypothetical protein
MQERLQEIRKHLREDIEKVDEPQLKAMFETSAQVLGGLIKAFRDYEQKNGDVTSPAHPRCGWEACGCVCPSSPLKLMMDRLVCADDGNPDPTRTHGKDAVRAKERRALCSKVSRHSDPGCSLRRGRVSLSRGKSRFARA